MLLIIVLNIENTIIIIIIVTTNTALRPWLRIVHCNIFKDYYCEKQAFANVSEVL